MFLIYCFAIPFARRYTFRAFWIIHMTYPVFFIQMILHGSGRMIQAPYFYYFFMGPLLLFVFDQLLSVSRRKVEIKVVKAELLPSGECRMK
jgi:dual oxidase